MFFSSQKDVPLWDMFKSFPSQIESGSARNNQFFETVIYILKVLIYGLLFVIVLCSGIAAKTAILFATSQLQKNQTLFYSGRFSIFTFISKEFIVDHDHKISRFQSSELFKFIFFNKHILGF